MPGEGLDGGSLAGFPEAGSRAFAAAIGDAAEFLDVEMHQVAGSRMLIANGVPCPETQPGAACRCARCRTA